jgi:hypothetical protein
MISSRVLPVAHHQVAMPVMLRNFMALRQFMSAVAARYFLAEEMAAPKCEWPSCSEAQQQYEYTAGSLQLWPAGLTVSA